MTSRSYLALMPVDADVASRLNALSAELQYAWDRSNSDLLREWGSQTAKTFGTSLKRRVSNLGDLFWRVTKGTWDELTDAKDAYNSDRLVDHLSRRASAAYNSAEELISQVTLTSSQIAKSVVDNPREAIPQLLTLIATSLVVSGGVDGNGGAPDVDLMFGIDAHRSILSHSILMGATLETGILAVISLVRLVHDRLPAKHDPLWDKILEQSESIANAGNVGVSLGMSYHLFVDGLLQPAAYHDLPFSMAMEEHQAVIIANATSEAIDTRNKPK